MTPWAASDAPSHTKKADTKEKKALWARIANKYLADGYSEASAIKAANAAIKNMS